MTTWHHSPSHFFGEAGAYIVTAGTFQRIRHFNTQERLSLLQGALFRLADEHGIELQAWAVMSNHYHFVALAPSDRSDLGKMIARLHAGTAKEINAADETPGRRIWFQYWDTHLTYQRSYYARVNYVHQNPVHHGLATVASAYPWCSAAWFETTAAPSFFRTVNGFKTDQVKVYDDF